MIEPLEPTFIAKLEAVQDGNRVNVDSITTAIIVRKLDEVIAALNALKHAK